MAMDKEEILRIITDELSNTDDLESDLENSLSYYLGQLPVKPKKSRSKVTSTDVADSIEWIMPQVMKSFTQSNEIVHFDPVHAGDELQAQLESQYVYEVLMKQNDGFVILYQFVKDALMQKNGILKVYYAKHTHTKKASYTGITKDQLDYLVSQEGVEILSKDEYVDQNQTKIHHQEVQMKLQQVMSQVQQQMQQSKNPQPMGQPQLGQAPTDQGPAANQGIPPQAVEMIKQLQAELEAPVMLYNVKVSVERIKGQIYVESIPPENFRVNSSHNSINIDKARFACHTELKTVSDIIEEYGLTKNEATNLPNDVKYDDNSYRFEFQNESVFYNYESIDQSQKQIRVAECMINIDINQDGIATYTKITVCGEDNPTEILSIEDVEEKPFVSTTAIIMSHKFRGLSITDRIKEIQDQKTALWRNTLDNMYLQNNQRTIVVENMVNMDDLLVSRPGGLIRAKRTDAVVPYPTPQLNGDAQGMLEYLDKIRAGRTGVEADGTATPQSLGDRVGSQGVDRLMNAKEELVGLIIRVIAETGVKPLCVKIRDLTIKHIDSVVDFRFRGQWQKIQPSQWIDRTNCTVQVGTGAGNLTIKTTAVKEIIALQAQIVAAPGSPAEALLNPNVVYNALDDYCRFSGLNGASRYFIDPNSDEGKQSMQRIQEQQAAAQKQQQEFQNAMAQSQLKIAEAEMGKVQAQNQANQIKAELDAAKLQSENEKSSFEAQLNMVKQQLEEARAVADRIKSDGELDFKYYKTDADNEVKLAIADKAAEKDLTSKAIDSEDKELDRRHDAEKTQYEKEHESVENEANREATREASKDDD